MSMTVDSPRSVSSMLGDIAGSVERIARAEFRLARVEFRNEIRRLERASLLVAVGAVVASLALAFMLLAAVYALSTVMTPPAAALLVGLVAAAVSLICVTAGMKRMTGIALPKTTASIQESFQWTKTRAR
jgi:hypothetical protein